MSSIDRDLANFVLDDLKNSLGEGRVCFFVFCKNFDVTVSDIICDINVTLEAFNALEVCNFLSLETQRILKET